MSSVDSNSIACYYFTIGNALMALPDFPQPPLMTGRAGEPP